MLARSAVRVSELCDLRLRDVRLHDPGGSGSRPSWARRRRSHPNGSSSRGGRRCPTTTPHNMRRTYIANPLLVDGFDVTWVMSQVGRADSKMTLDVYAQLEQRVDRSHGTAFDALLRRARGDEPEA